MACGKQVDLLNKVFGKLTVIAKSKSILGGNTIKRYWGTWKCKCECGKIIIVKTINLNNGTVSSCGCLYKQYGKSLKPGQKINKLTTISYKDGKWFCLCDCGNNTEVLTNSLTNNNTKSCGCLKSETSSINSSKMILSKRKYEPHIASARRVWKNYCYRDINCVDFDTFFKISQQNCYYCNVPPNTTYNYFLTSSSNSSKKAKLEGAFIYNEIGRLDSSKPYTIDNIVSCCSVCNKSKNNRSLEVFLLWINNLQPHKENSINIINCDLPIENKSLISSIKCVFYNYKKDTNLTLEEYYSVSQMNCFYCDQYHSNIFNKAKSDKKSSAKAKENGNYLYNGIDRIDSSLLHNKNNIVPCCKWCNFAKSNLSLKEFYSWMQRIKSFQKQKELNLH
tara:strand:+ start:4293 stop:5468 length:1176 start_codon:yes stop_codon:yes gene_type:complete